MATYWKKAFKDLARHRFLSIVTILTFVLSILIVGSFGLFFLNANDVMKTWKRGIRVMVYLKEGISEPERLDTRSQIKAITGVMDTRYISKSEALEQLRQQLKQQSSLLNGLNENPLPDAFEVTLQPDARQEEAVALIARRIESINTVSDTEYGQLWIQGVSKAFDLFRLAGYGLGGLFFTAAVLITANTIRLVLYSRREEIEVMRLVGAAKGFIKAPFFLESLIQGACGSIIALALLYAAYHSVNAHMEQGVLTGFMVLRFFSPPTLLEIVLAGMAMGWLGCYISLKQFLKG
jgi:cell division transport system permease protein